MSGFLLNKALQSVENFKRIFWHNVRKYLSDFIILTKTLLQNPTTDVIMYAFSKDVALLSLLGIFSNKMHGWTLFGKCAVKIANSQMTSNSLKALYRLLSKLYAFVRAKKNRLLIAMCFFLVIILYYLKLKCCSKSLLFKDVGISPYCEKAKDFYYDL